MSPDQKLVVEIILQLLSVDTFHLRLFTLALQGLVKVQYKACVHVPIDSFTSEKFVVTLTWPSRPATCLE